MPFDASRRVFLPRGRARRGVGVGMAPSSLLVRTALRHFRQAEGARSRSSCAAAPTGLNLCVPYGDSDYYNLRQGIAIPRPGQVRRRRQPRRLPRHAPGARAARAALPRRPPRLHPRGPASPAVSRPHFDAQDFQESGTPGNKQTPTGWPDRAIADIPGREVTQAVSCSSQLVRSFLGPEPVLVAQPLALLRPAQRATGAREAETLLTSMYTGRSRRAGRDQRARDLRRRSTRSCARRRLRPPNGASYPAGTAGNALRQAAWPDQERRRHALRLRQHRRRLRHPLEPARRATSTTHRWPLGMALSPPSRRDLGGLLDDVWCS